MDILRIQDIAKILNLRIRRTEYVHISEIVAQQWRMVIQVKDNNENYRQKKKKKRISQFPIVQA